MGCRHALLLLMGRTELAAVRASQKRQASIGMLCKQQKHATSLGYGWLQLYHGAAVLPGLQVAPSEPLMAAGLDSLGSVELRNALEGRLQLQLPSTLVFDYPSTDAIAQYVASKVAPVPGER